VDGWLARGTKKPAISGQQDTISNGESLRTQQMCSTSLGHCRCAAVKDSAVILLVRIALLDVLKRKKPAQWRVAGLAAECRRMKKVQE